MWKIIADWLQAFLNMTRELQEHRTSIRHLESRARDLEEAIKLLAQEQRHSRELETAAREKLLLQIGQQVAGPKALSAPQRKGKNRQKPGKTP